MELFPLSWIFFVPFIIVTSFAVLNLFIGIIVDAMQIAQQTDRSEDKKELKTYTHNEVQELLDELRQLKQEVKGLSGKVESIGGNRQ